MDGDQKKMKSLEEKYKENKIILIFSIDFLVDSFVVERYSIGVNLYYRQFVRINDLNNKDVYLILQNVVD
jgi:hypothetical protein